METAELFVALVKSLPQEQQKRVSYWGPDATYAYVKAQTPVRRLFVTRQQMKDWFLPYVLTFGATGFPKEAEGVAIIIPTAYLWLAWGFPDRLLQRVHAAGAVLYLQVDSEEDARKYATTAIDGIVTDNIDTLGRYFAAR